MGQGRNCRFVTLFKVCPDTNKTIGRGVLIDYVSWAEKKGIKYTTFSQHEIKLSDIHEIAKECNITFQKGDILFVRIGVTKEWDQLMDESAKKAYAANASPHHAGVEGTMDVLRWLWDSGFTAIAGDAISWEVGRSRLSWTILGRQIYTVSGLSTQARRHHDARVHPRRMGRSNRYVLAPSRPAVITVH